MSRFEEDVTTLENALRSFVQTMKRPQQWTRMTAAMGVVIDRSSAFILQTLILHEPKELRVQDLAHILGIESPSITRKTQELESRGYISRRQDPNDKRAVSLHVTGSGRKLAAKLWKAQRQNISDVLKHWPAQDRRQFVDLFARFSNDLVDEAKFADKN